MTRFTIRFIGYYNFSFTYMSEYEGKELLVYIGGSANYISTTEFTPLMTVELDPSLFRYDKNTDTYFIDVETVEEV